VSGYAVQGTSASGFFFLLELMPAFEDLGGGDDSFLAKNMGVTTDKFFGQLLGDRPEVEGLTLLGELGVKDDVEEDIAEFLPKRLVIALVNGFEKFVDLLQNHRPKSPMGLLAIPRAALRTAQAGHDFGQSANFIHPLEIRGRRAFVESWRDAG